MISHKTIIKFVSKLRTIQFIEHFLCILELSKKISKLDNDIQSHSRWLEEVKNYTV